MATHIINVSFGLNHYVKTKTREKHSYGQEIVFSNIKLPEVFEVYFSDSPTGKSKTVVGQNNKVLIPDEYFLSGKTIYCYLLVHDTSTDGRMKYVVEIPIEQRPEPTDIGLDPVQQDKKVVGGGHLRRSLYNRFSVHGRINKKRPDIPEFVFFVYVRSVRSTEYRIPFYIHRNLITNVGNAHISRLNVQRSGTLRRK